MAKIFHIEIKLTAFTNENAYAEFKIEEMRKTLYGK
jgi:hypothetical protein